MLGGDSALEFQGATLGKPHVAEVAIERWKQLRGNHGVLHSGHCLIDNRDPAAPKVVSKTSSTKVYFSNITDAEIEALALAHPTIVAELAGSTPKKVIARAPKLVNIVA